MTGDPWLDLSDEERQLFLAEGGELLDQLEAGLLDLETGQAGPGTVHAVFRAAHTLKGSAATVGLDGMAQLTHAMENRLDAWRQGQAAPAPGEISRLLAAVDSLRAMLAAVAAGNTPPPPPAELVSALASPPPPDAAAPLEEPAAGTAAAGPARWLVEAELDPACLMPAVRALQVLLALEEQATLVASEPPRDGLEATWAGNRVRAWVEDTGPAERLQQMVAAVPDVAAVRVVPAEGGRQPAPAPAGAPLQDPGAAPRPAGAVHAPAAANAVPTGEGAEPEGPVLAGLPDPAPAGAAAGPLAAGRPAPAPAGEDRTIRVDVALLDRLLNLVGELVVERGRLGQLGQELGRRPAVHDLADELFRVTGQIARITGALQDAVLQARMLPVARIFRRFPRLVRDLALMLGKEVELELVGEDTELDRTLHEVVADPLLHLVRNALDHGIEAPEERRRAGKPATGRVRLVAAREGHHVLIRVEDDGRGLDPQRLRRAAVEKGLISPDRAAALSDREAFDLMFLPGFSTAARVTGVSGRGVGLDVVRQRLEQAGGRVEVHSRLGQGTAFTLVLPLTLATLRALLVEVGDYVYALPLSDVGEAVRVTPGELRSLQGRWVTTVRGQVVPLLWLRQFGDPRFGPQPGDEPLVAVLVERRGQPIGLVVDRLLGEQEVVVKGLGELLAGTRGLSGATILGDGRLALILDTPTLVAELAAAAAGPAAARAGEGGPPR
ncbi:chemotaxis protein CheA [Thermaerobacter subterraneus]|uniref:Chemotaxis protein CheA n=1 Tax=Thermaerobacter subterraneus DSM 13965 TaxID=867903 RepID=K6QE53_9FIRM|nr:chemotaxis protein CheA [Thermaerobacter subterraneus]EKP95046.1 chemotaxis protein histidine kinase-like protein [Thermaerobacter subterraneus DSM 13965]